MDVYLERGADLHVAQLMPLPLTVSCFNKFQIGFTFLVPAHTKGPLNGCVCVTDSTDSPGCLPILLSIHVFYFLVFLFFHFLVVGSVR